MTETARETHRGEFEEALSDLLKINLIARAHVGKPAGTMVRPVTDNTFDYAIHLHFESKENHDAYQVHPDHDTFVERCRDWWAKVKVYDTELVSL